MNLEILYEDEEMLAINKPSGLTVNRSDTTALEKTLQDLVEEYLELPTWEKKIIDTYNDEEVFKSRAGIVHRLDKETSGVILVAKKINAFKELQRQFKERLVKKTYISLCHGKVIPLEGEVRVPLGRLPWNRKRFGVVADGKESLTKYKVLEYYLFQRETVSLVELYPFTGRTHQIRVHMKHLGYPLIGDELYSGRKTARNDRKIIPRVFLHSSEILFYHPATNALLHIKAPLPVDLQEFMGMLMKVAI